MKSMLAKYENTPNLYWGEGAGLRDAFATLDACPPEDENVEIEFRMTPTQTGQLVETFSRWVQSITPLALAQHIDTVAVLDGRVPRDLHDARALAWAGWQEIFRLREQVAPWAWDRAFLLEDDGTWPTRDAEHAAWAGRYRAREGGGQTGGDTESPELAATPAPSGPEVVAGGDECPRCGAPPDIDFVERYHRCQCCNLKLPQPAPAPAQSAAPMPESGFTLEQVTLEVSGIAKRIAALETAVMGHECAGPKELIASARLDALAAQVGRLERAVRWIADDHEESCGWYHSMKRCTCRRAELDAIITDGGPDVPA